MFVSSIMNVCLLSGMEIFVESSQYRSRWMLLCSVTFSRSSTHLYISAQFLTTLVFFLHSQLSSFILFTLALLSYKYNPDCLKKKNFFYSFSCITAFSTIAYNIQLGEYSIQLTRTIPLVSLTACTLP